MFNFTLYCLMYILVRNDVKLIIWTDTNRLKISKEKSTHKLPKQALSHVKQKANISKQGENSHKDDC